MFGALLESIGWVRALTISLNCVLTSEQRAIFLAQFPIALLAGVGVYLSVPSFPEQESAAKGKTIMQKLATLDYAGAIALVSHLDFDEPVSVLTHIGRLYRHFPLRLVWGYQAMASTPLFRDTPHLYHH